MRIRLAAFAQIDLKKATITIKDGAAAEVEVKVGKGNLTFTEKRNVEYSLDRGLLDEVREGDEVPLDVKFDFTWEYIIGDIRSIIKGEGYTSTDSDSCRPYACDIEVSFDMPCSTTATATTVTLSDFRWEQFDYDLSGGAVSVSGKCNTTTPTFTTAT